MALFSKLKEKLKSSLSIFSRKVAEAPQEAEPAKVEPERAVTPVPKKNQEKVVSKSEPVSEHPPGMICDDKKGICIPVELAEAIKKPEQAQPQSQPESKQEKKQKPAAEPKIEKKPVQAHHEKKVESKVEKTEAEPQDIMGVKSEKSQATVPEKKGFFTKAKELFTTKTISAAQFDDLFSTLERVLLESNVAFDVVEKIKEDLKLKLINRPLPRNLESVVQRSLKDSLSSVVVDSTGILNYLTSKKPFVIAFFGINGSGKTTTIAKIAHLLKESKKSCVIAAGDTFRAAAIQQLEEHASRLNIRLIKHEYGSDAAAVAFDAVKFAQKNAIDIVLIDTAGRLHSDSNLMDELKKIVRVTKPDLKIFVGESITGNDCIEQAQQFNEQIGIDAIILTKADVDEKGGTALSISYVTQKPIMYIGTGQEYDDLLPFSKDVVLKNLGLV